MDNRFIVLTLGPGDEKYRRAWFDYLKGKEGVWACQNMNYTKKWKDIYTDRIREDYETDDMYIESFLAEVKKYLDDLPSVEKIICQAPDIKAD